MCLIKVYISRSIYTRNKNIIGENIIYIEKQVKMSILMIIIVNHNLEININEKIAH